MPADENAPTQEEFPAEEAVPPEGEMTPTETVMQHTVEEIPELAGLAVGDTLEAVVVNVSDDGNTYDLQFVPKPPVEPEAPPAAAPAAGREQISGAMMGA